MSNSTIAADKKGDGGSWVNIIAFEVEDWERPAFESLQGEHRIEFVAASLTTQNARDYADAEVEVVCPFIYSDLSADVLQHFGRIRLIATRSTGFDHIDLGYCKDKDITVCNVPVYGDNTLAEHVFALLLAISHNMIAAVDRTRRGDFSGRFGAFATGYISGMEGPAVCRKILGACCNAFRFAVMTRETSGLVRVGHSDDHAKYSAAGLLVLTKKEGIELGTPYR